MPELRITEEKVMVGCIHTCGAGVDGGGNRGRLQAVKDVMLAA